MKAKKTIEQREKDFYDSLVPFVEQYGREMVREFHDYWIERNPTGKKLRFETQKIFELPRRLARWNYNNLNKFNARNNQTKSVAISASNSEKLNRIISGEL